MSNKLITIGIPAYNAENHICDCLASIQIQSIVDELSIIIAKDNPNNDYDFVKERFPNLDIAILECEKNTGAGLTRQRAEDECKTEWITFIDADDVFISPYSLESLKNNITPNCIEVMGTFFQEIEQGNMNIAQKQQIIQTGGQIPPRMMPRNDIGHPWVFGRLYNVKYLRQNNIRFSSLRAMEDGEKNWKIRLLTEGSPLTINVINEPIYLWRTGSEHSITRIGAEENDGTPLYSVSLCHVGSTVAAINAINFCKKKNPFNGGITRFCVEQMVGQYFSYIESLEKSPMFSEQCWFNAKRFYTCAYKDIENQISDEILNTIYLAQFAGRAQDLNFIPKITFFQFMDKVKSEKFGGEKEFNSIREKLPQWVIDLELKSGVLGTEGYIYCDNEIKDKEN